MSNNTLIYTIYTNIDDAAMIKSLSLVINSRKLTNKVYVSVTPTLVTTTILPRNDDYIYKE